MPKRKKATLRELSTAESHIEHLRERDRAFMKGMEHLESVLNSGVPAEEVVKQLRQAQFELRTALQVAQRHHELRLQELQTSTKFPDEDKDQH